MTTKLLHDKIKRFRDLNMNETLKNEFLNDVESWLDAIEKYLFEVESEKTYLCDKIKSFEEAIEMFVMMLIVTGNTHLIIEHDLLDPDVQKKALKFLLDSGVRTKSIFGAAKLIELNEPKDLKELLNHAGKAN